MKSKQSVENALNLPTQEQLNEILGLSVPEVEEEEVSEFDYEHIKNSLSQLKEMRTQLKDLPDVTSRKKMLNTLADRAESAFEEVFNLATNGLEPRFVAEMINSASHILKIAMDAHSKIIDSDIKLIDLQIKKDKIEYDISKQLQKPSDESVNITTSEGEYEVIHRNKILNDK